MSDTSYTCDVSSMQRHTGQWRVQARIVEDDGATIDLEHCGRNWKAMANAVESDVRALLAVIRPGADVTFRYISGESERLIESDAEDWGDWDHWQEPEEEEVTA